MMANDDLYDCLWPGGVIAVDKILLAPRSDLTGKRIGFLWDNVFRGDEIFPILEKSISKRDNKVEFVGYEQFGSIFGNNESNTLTNLPKYIKKLEIDAIISGIGC
jgi:hypothetical protein